MSNPRKKYTIQIYSRHKAKKWQTVKAAGNAKQHHQTVVLFRMLSQGENMEWNNMIGGQILLREAAGVDLGTDAFFDKDLCGIWASPPAAITIEAMTTAIPR